MIHCSNLTKDYKSFLLTTHDMTDIEKVCARAIMINKGKKLFDGTLEALRQNSRSDSRVTVRLEKAVSPTLEEEVARYSERGMRSESHAFVFSDGVHGLRLRLRISGQHGARRS